MRWVFVLLLLANLVYLGWEMDREADLRLRQAGHAAAVPPSTPPLRLVRELAEPPPLRAPPRPGPDAAPVPDLVAELPEIRPGVAELVGTASCFRYGPVPEEGMARGLHDWFRSRGAAAKLRAEAAPAADLYWIYLAPQASRESALAVLEDLRSHGAGDYRLIARGDLENAISLGLYTGREAMEARRSELASEGYVPVVVPYEGVDRLYWLDVRVPAGSAAMAGLYDGYPARYGSLPVKCGDISVSDPGPADYDIGP